MRTSVVAAIAAACSVGLIAGCSSSTKGKPDGSGPPSSASSPATSPASGSSSNVPAGGQTMSSDEIHQLQGEVAAAMRATTSFHMAGATKDNDGSSLQFDIHFGPDQKVDGSFTQHGETTKVINVGDGSIYFQAPDSEWQKQGGAPAVALFHGKWAKASATDKRFSDLTGTFNKDAFIKELTSDNGTGEGLRKVGPVVVDGTPATQYASTTDKSVIFIAASGPPLLLKGGTPPNDLLAFTDYNKDYPFAAPPAAQTVDISKLGG